MQLEAAAKKCLKKTSDDNIDIIIVKEISQNVDIDQILYHLEFGRTMASHDHNENLNHQMTITVYDISCKRPIVRCDDNHDNGMK